MSTSAANPQADGLAQRHRSVGQDSENQLATGLLAGAVA